MPLRVLVASDSEYRLWWYEEQLQRYGVSVVAVSDGLRCIERMRSTELDVVLLEPALRWGGALGVLAVRSDDPQLQRIPIVLVAVDGVTAEWYQLANYSVQGLLLRRPTGQKLAATLDAAAKEHCVTSQ